MKKNNEVAILEKELNPILEKAKLLSIKNPDDMKIATEELSKLNLAKDKVIEKMETITQPAKATIKAAGAIWKPFIVMAKEAIENIREKMSEYQTAETIRVREEEGKISDRTGDGKGKLKFETAVRKIGEIDRPADKVVSDSGSLNFREDKQFEIIDVTMLPHEFILPNEIKIRAVMMVGTELPGVRYFMKMVPINTR